jgi:hypothetical protein
MLAARPSPPTGLPADSTVGVTITVLELARMLVGAVGLKEAQVLLRRAMHGEALARAGGSRRGAAKILRVDRRYVQRMAGDTNP